MGTLLSILGIVISFLLLSTPHIVVAEEGGAVDPYVATPPVVYTNAEDMDGPDYITEPNSAADRHRLTSTKVKVDKHSYCFNLTGIGANNIFVPLRTANEWQSFRIRFATDTTNVKLRACNGVGVPATTYVPEDHNGGEGWADMSVDSSSEADSGSDTDSGTDAAGTAS